GRIFRREIIAVPPEPVAALGGQAGFVGLLALRAWGCALERRAGLAEKLPGLVVLGMADPDAEVGVDPAPAVHARDARPGRPLGDLVLRQDGGDRAGGELLVERVE